MRTLLKSRNGFTLVELMVVVVVLGIIAGIAVQRMGDVRDRAETAAREANVRILLGAANLARTRNYGHYMWHHSGENRWRNGTIRWQRPCEKPPVAQLMAEGGTYGSGYLTFTDNDPNEGPNLYLWHGSTWNTSQQWNLTDFLESFPVGYAVEIVFPPNEHSENEGPRDYGYHQDRLVNPESPDNVYMQKSIYIYKFDGSKLPANHAAWEDFDNNSPDRPGGGDSNTDTQGTNYPYMTGTHALSADDWVEVFPVDRYSN